MAQSGSWITETTDTAGQGDINLTGKVDTFTSFASAVGTGSVWYSVIDDNGNREAGLGNFNGTTTLVRNIIHATYVNGVYDDTTPQPIELSGSGVVSCTLNSRAYQDIFEHISTSGNPHGTVAANIPYDSSQDPVTDYTDLQMAMLDQSKSIEERVASGSGLYDGGLITQTGPTTFSVSAGNGAIFDSYTDPSNTGVIPISWSEQVDLDLYINGFTIGTTHIFLDDTGSIIQTVGTINLANFRTHVFLGNIYFYNGQITEIINAPQVAKQTATDAYDVMNYNITVKGAEIRPVNSALSIWSNSGSIFYPGINWENDHSSPNINLISAVGDANTPAEMCPIYLDGSADTCFFTIPKQRNTTGNTLVNLTGKKATIHRIYGFGIGATRQLIFLYGQFEYADAQEAQDNLHIDDTNIVLPEELTGAFLLAHICVGNQASDFTDPNKAWITTTQEVLGSTTGVPISAASVSFLPNGHLLSENVQAAIEEVDGHAENKMEWMRGGWTSGLVLENQVVRDGDWTMVALEDNEERPAPQPIGNQESSLPDSPTWTTPAQLAVIDQDHHHVFTKGGWFEEVEVWVPVVTGNTHYEVIIFDPLSGNASVVTLPTLTSGQWNTVALGSRVQTVGSELILRLTSINESSSTVVTGGWNYNGSSQGNAPSNQGWNRDNQHNILRIDKTDLDTVDRTSELLGMTSGSVIQFVQTNDTGNSWSYTVQGTPTDQGTYIQFSVTRTDNEGDIVVGQPCTMTGTIPVPASTDYVVLADHWTNTPTSFSTTTSRLFFDGVQQADTNDAYGIRIKFQEASISDKYEVVAYSSSTSSGGGGGGVDPTANYNWTGEHTFSGDIAGFPDFTGLKFGPEGELMQHDNNGDSWIFIRDPLGLAHHGIAMSFTSGLRWYDQNTGFNDIYHEGRKPTPAEIGADDTKMYYINNANTYEIDMTSAKHHEIVRWNSSGQVNIININNVSTATLGHTISIVNVHNNIGPATINLVNAGLMFLAGGTSDVQHTFSVVGEVTFISATSNHLMMQKCSAMKG